MMGCRGSKPPMVGFSLLEVIITIGLLAMLTIFVTSMMKGSFDVRFGITEVNNLSQRMNNAFRMISEDLTHAYIIPATDTTRLGARKRKTIFAIKSSGSGDELTFTTKNHQPKLQNVNESDQTFVVYKLDQKEGLSEQFYHLYRGASKIIPESFRDEPEMHIVADFIKSFKVSPFDGDKFTNFGWHSIDKSEYRDKLPRMVKVEIEAYELDVSNPPEEPDLEKMGTAKYSTIVFIFGALEYAQVKNNDNTERYRYQFE